LENLFIEYLYLLLNFLCKPILKQDSISKKLPAFRRLGAFYNKNRPLRGFAFSKGKRVKGQKGINP